MTHEFEAAVADSGASLLRYRPHERHVRPPGSPCANCGEILKGPWCHACGQVGEDFHRSTWKLLAESVEGLTHLDSRVWRTLPDLALRPGRLTRSYLDGHRAPQLPPLRLFLIVLLLIFSVGFSPIGSNAVKSNASTSTAAGGAAADKVRAKLEIAGAKIEATPGLTPAQRAAIQGDLKAAEASKAPPMVRLGETNLTDDQKAAIKRNIDRVHVSLGPRDASGLTMWLRERLVRAVDHPEEFKLVLESWSERFAFLMLPISAFLLTVLFIFQRRFYVFDHLIFSMHSLSFQGVVLSVFFLLAKVGEDANWMLLACPVHLFFHMRGVYQTGVFTTLLRMAALFMGSLIGFVVLMLGLVLVGLSNLPA